MSLSSHLEELKRKHQDLSEKVEEAQRAPGTIDLEIRRPQETEAPIKEEIARSERKRLKASPSAIRRRAVEAGRVGLIFRPSREKCRAECVREE